MDGKDKLDQRPLSSFCSNSLSSSTLWSRELFRVFRCCCLIWSKFSPMGDNKEDRETEALAYPSIVILLSTGSWQDEPQWIENSVSWLTWRISVAQVAYEPSGSQRDTKRSQSSAAFSLVCKDWECLTEKGKATWAGHWIIKWDRWQLCICILLLSEGNVN